jgi:hypothetical protein
LQRIHQPIAGTGLIAEMMCLIDHHDIIGDGLQHVRMLSAPRRRQRGDYPRLRPERHRILPQKCVVGGGTVDAEFFRHLLAPLSHQWRRHQDQDALSHTAQQILLEDHARLDGLAQADLVRQQHPAAILLEHLADRLNLIPVRLDAAQGGQAQQFVKTFHQPELRQLRAQVEPG